MSVSAVQRPTSFQVRSLFRSLLRQSSQFSNYNFREYARRKTIDSFREHQQKSEERQIQELIQDGLQNLRLLKRQTIISQFYQLDKLVVEGQKTGKETGQEGGIVRQKDNGSSRSGRHLDGNRRSGHIDHDIFEGLPVRRWSRQQHTFSQAPKTEDSGFSTQGPGGSGGLPELAMPRDSNILPPLSRALLRAARAGCIYVRSNGRAAEEEEKKETTTDADGDLSVDRSFTSRRWTTLPKQLEPADVEFLAKRRPGLQSLYGGSAADGNSAATPGPMRRTKFKKTDPDTGVTSIYEAWVPEGHRIEGEITGDAQTLAQQADANAKPEMPAPGTIVEGVGRVNSEGVVVAEAGSASVLTPPKRRPPPPKRKGKGIGKGRKKKVMFAPGEGADAATVHGVPGTFGGAKQEDGSHISIDQAGQDDDEDDDGEEDDSDDGDDGDESVMDAKTPDQSAVDSTDQVDLTADQSNDVEMTDAGSEVQPPVDEHLTTPGSYVPSPQTAISPEKTEPPLGEVDISASITAPAAQSEEIKPTEIPGELNAPETEPAADEVFEDKPQAEAIAVVDVDIVMEESIPAEKSTYEETDITASEVQPNEPVEETPTIEPTPDVEQPSQEPVPVPIENEEPESKSPVPATSEELNEDTEIGNTTLAEPQPVSIQDSEPPIKPESPAPEPVVAEPTEEGLITDTKPEEAFESVPVETASEDIKDEPSAPSAESI
ncbi:LYR family protein [Penicillium taxi]|uniref:LYR family protein n=1 Tax=Penicillium taxi TaxID=168475 RepID=UPI002545A397|nr:LYR family protein [Penicillium taxi]KAJ5885005.1 LYR family protein [Penicillium taxi]